MTRRLLAAFALLCALPLSAATLHVDLSRNGFAGPVEIAIAPRVEGATPQWSATKTIAAGKTSTEFADLAAGLYVVIARGSQPLERLSVKANLGTAGGKVRFVIPKSQAQLRVTLAHEPLPRAAVMLVQDELRWSTELTTGDDGRFAGALWEPGKYDASVRRERDNGPHIVGIQLGAGPLTIDVPDRHITGRVIGEDGKPIANAIVALKTESTESKLNVRTQTAPDGQFEFFGVRDGAQSILARAPNFLQSDPVAFELRGAPASRNVDFKLSRGVQRVVRVVDGRDQPLANASLFAACDGHVKSTSTTNAEGRANVAVPASGWCAIYAIPREGSIAVVRPGNAANLTIRVPAGASSLKLTLKSEAGEAFPDLSLLMRIDGNVVPPAVARQLRLVTDADGRVELQHIPPGTYEFWPYRNEAEGRLIYETAMNVAAPISLNVLTGVNEATVKFRARR